MSHLFYFFINYLLEKLLSRKNVIGMADKINGWIHDDTEYEVIVTISSNEQGKLLANVDYPDGDLEFTDVYEADPIEFSIVATKNFVGWKHPEEVSFEFTLKNTDGTVVSTATNINGVITFPAITYTAEGVYPYVISETSTHGSGWTVDSSVYRVIINVTDYGAGQLVATAEYLDGPPNFINTYQTIDGQAIITGTKQAVGAPLSEGKFSFGLFDNNNNLIQTVTNDRDGVFTFAPISYTDEGINHYTVKELTTSGGGWITDTTVFPVVVTVTDNRQGNLVVDLTYPDGQPNFVNTFETKAVEVELEATKTAIGAALKDGQFEFGIFDADNNLVQTATNDASGKIQFPPLSFDTENVYKYKVREITPSGKDGPAI